MVVLVKLLLFLVSVVMGFLVMLYFGCTPRNYSGFRNFSDSVWCAVVNYGLVLPCFRLHLVHASELRFLSAVLQLLFGMRLGEGRRVRKGRGRKEGRGTRDGDVDGDGGDGDVRDGDWD